MAIEEVRTAGRSMPRIRLMRLKEFSIEIPDKEADSILSRESFSAEADISQLIRFDLQLTKPSII